MKTFYRGSSLFAIVRSVSLLFIALLLGANSIHAQNAFYDAKKLARWNSLDDLTKLANVNDYYATILNYFKDEEPIALTSLSATRESILENR
jgi:hypothetical protein